jgi:hypothetical protein
LTSRRCWASSVSASRTWRRSSSDIANSRSGNARYTAFSAACCQDCRRSHFVAVSRSPISAFRSGQRHVIPVAHPLKNEKCGASVTAVRYQMRAPWADRSPALADLEVDLFSDRHPAVRRRPSKMEPHAEKFSRELQQRAFPTLAPPHRHASIYPSCQSQAEPPPARDEEAIAGMADKSMGSSRLTCSCRPARPGRSGATGRGREVPGADSWLMGLAAAGRGSVSFALG